jgi:hypothetical protein
MSARPRIALDGAARRIGRFAAALLPGRAGAIHREVLIVDALDLDTQRVTSLLVPAVALRQHRPLRGAGLAVLFDHADGALTDLR